MAKLTIDVNSKYPAPETFTKIKSMFGEGSEITDGGIGGLAAPLFRRIEHRQLFLGNLHIDPRIAKLRGDRLRDVEPLGSRHIHRRRKAIREPCTRQELLGLLDIVGVGREAGIMANAVRNEQIGQVCPISAQ